MSDRKESPGKIYDDEHATEKLGKVDCGCSKCHSVFTSGLTHDSFRPKISKQGPLEKAGCSRQDMPLKRKEPSGNGASLDWPAVGGSPTMGLMGVARHM